MKYKPEGTIWDVYLQVQGDYRFIYTQRPTVWRPDSGRQNLFIQTGPRMHINLNKTWEVRLSYLYVAGYGYVSENRAGIRLRYSF